MATQDRSVPIYLTWDAEVFQFDAILNEGHDLSSTVTEHPVEEGSNIADHVRPDPIKIQIKGMISETPLGRDADYDRLSEVLQLYADSQAAPTAPDPPGAPAPTSIFQGPDYQFQLPLSVRIGDGSGGFSQNAPGGITTAQGFGGPSPPLGSLLSLNGITNFGLNALFANQFNVNRASDLQSKGGSFTVQQALDRNRLPGQNFSALIDVPKTTRHYIAAALSLLKDLKDTATLLKIVAPHAYYENMVLRQISFDRGPAAGGSATFSLSLTEVRLVSTSSVAAPQPTIDRANPAQSKGAQAPVKMVQPPPSILGKLAGVKNNNPLVPEPYVPPDGAP